MIVRLANLATQFSKKFMKPKMRNRIHVVTDGNKLKILTGVTLAQVAEIDHEAWLKEVASEEVQSEISYS